MYSSLMAAAHLIMMMEWGKVTDRIGNQPILLGVGVLVALTPVLWLGTQSGALSLWLGFPLLFLLQGATMAGMDLGNSNIQFELATTHRSSTYFAIAAAVSGLSGALGTTLGGWLMQFPSVGGFFGLFALSGVVRLVALLPLLLVEEPRSRIRFKRWRFV
jgi:MFS family permease